MAPAHFQAHLGLWVSLCLAALVACGGSDEKSAGATAAPAAVAKPTPAAPQAEETLADEPDEEEGEEIEVELPADVPRYPGSKPRASQGAQDQDELGVSVTLESSDDAQTIANYYAIQLRLKNWVIQETPADEGLAIFADKGTRSLTVMITPGPTGSEIGILVLDMQ